MRSFGLVLAALLALATNGRAVQAQPGERAVASRAEGRSNQDCAARHATAIAEVACELAQELKVGNARTQVVLTVSDPPAAPRELSLAVARALAGELGANARVATEPVTERALAGVIAGSDAVALRVKLEVDRLSASAEHFVGHTRFWARFRPGMRGSSEHAHAQHTLDAELRGYLPKLELVVSRIDRATGPDEPSLSLACGDLDGDGALEIVSVGRRRIQLGRVVAGAFRAARAVNWSELSPVAAQPLREPIATSRITAPGQLEVGSSDRAEALRLDATLAVTARLPGRVPWPGGGCARVLVAGLSDEREECATRAVPATATLGALDALAGARLVRASGERFDVFARRSRDGKLELELGTQRVSVSEPVGAQVALGDLDGDGRAELLTSVDTLDPSQDALVVRSVNAQGALAPAFRVEVPSGIRAIAVCPSEGARLTPVVLGTGNGLWVLR